MNSVSKAITDAVVLRLAGDRCYRRGYDYYQHGRVESLENDADGVHAVVRGNRDYAVNPSSDEGVLNYACDCPVGEDGTFCKHCVAVALAWLNREVAPAQAKPRGKAREATLADAAKILREEDKDTLMRMMLDWAKDDDRLRERLLMYAPRRSGLESGVAAASRAFERAVRVYDFVHYREASAWARGVDDAIDNIAQLPEDGHAVSVIESCESALQRLVAAAGAIDDSDGHLSVLRDRLQDIHFRACQEARPEPVALARRLFDREMHSDLDVFYGAAERYAKILGAKGVKEYRQLAEAEWEKVPARTAKDKHSEWGRHDDAMTLVWAEFFERPYLETYRTLERHAKKAGNWPEWRDRALAEIRRRVAKAKEESRGVRAQPGCAAREVQDQAQLRQTLGAETEIAVPLLISLRLIGQIRPPQRRADGSRRCRDTS